MERRVPVTRVLVVDDEEDVRETLQFGLEIEGFDVRTAANGREAWELLGSGLSPALILLDLMMPVMNGIEFLNLVRADPRFHHIPVIVLTAFRGLANDLRARELTIQGLLEKPFSVEELLTTIESAENTQNIENTIERALL